MFRRRVTTHTHKCCSEKVNTTIMLLKSPQNTTITIKSLHFSRDWTSRTGSYRLIFMVPECSALKKINFAVQVKWQVTLPSN